MSAMFDFIIVGAGSSGCVLANRLSENLQLNVLLIEAGGDNKSPMVTMPKGIGKLVSDPKYAWHYAVDGNRGGNVSINEVWVRGRGLGGSSAVNGMIYVRGQPEDYALWEAAAGQEWSWKKMKWAFRAIEDHDLGDDGLRGVGGAVHISSNKFRYPLCEKIIEAGQQLGLERKEDLNSESQEGIGYYCHNIKKGRRQSAAVAFLNPIKQRPNLTIITQTLVDRIIFDEGRASAIECRQGDKVVVYKASREIILSAGTVNSSKLLQLSGIGPSELLISHGINVIHHSPDVGRRLLEHLGFSALYRLKNERGINHHYYGLGLLGSILRYFLFRKGALSTGPFEVGAFVRTNPDEVRPNLQFYLGGLTLAFSEDSNDPVPLHGVERQAGMTFSGSLLNLDSEGEITISSADPDAPLTITPNWLGSERDQQQAIEMVRYIREFAAQPALAPYIESETLPGIDIKSDADILDAVRKWGTCGTHAVRSCRMGKDETSVVDERLRVRGVSGLRVADCSVMPALISGNTNGPAMALGWRAADLILDDNN